MRLSESVNTILPVCAPRTEPPSVRVAYLCDFPLWATHTHARTHTRKCTHGPGTFETWVAVFFKKKTWKETASKADGQLRLLQLLSAPGNQWRPRCWLLQRSVPLPLTRLSRYYSAFQLLYRHRRKKQVWIPYFSFFFLSFFLLHINSPLGSCNKYERPLCCHFTLGLNMCHFTCRIRKQQKGVTGALRTTVDCCE